MLRNNFPSPVYSLPFVSAYMRQKDVSSSSCQLYWVEGGGGGGSLAFLVGMRTGPGCVEIRGVKVSSNLSRLNVLDRLMGSSKDIFFIELYLFERLDLVKPIVICS